MFAAKNTAAPSGEAVYIESVFSTYLYTGNGSTQTITNGIDLSGKGGLVWLKKRSSATGGSHRLMDTVRGGNKLLSSNTTGAESTSNQVTFLSSGFDVIDAVDNGATYASWTFRKQAKFFDVVTYTGNGVAGRTVSHSLGSVPGCIIVKRTDTTGSWNMYHRSLANTQFLALNLTDAAATATSYWNSTTPTSTEFTLGAGTGVNASGGTYVAYLFAHDAGGFGAAGADNVISCGSYTGNGSATGPTITLGYEPQWVMIKQSSAAGTNWEIIDSMRGFTVGAAGDSSLRANLTNAEVTATDYIGPTATGFNVTTSGTAVNSSGATYIYIAIRRGPMKTPTSGTSVFSPITYTGDGTNSRVFSGVNFATDMTFWFNRDKVYYSNAAHVFDKLRGIPQILYSNLTNAEAFYSGNISLSSYGNTNITMGSSAGGGWNFNGLSGLLYAFQRAPGFFDVVCYTGTGVTDRVVTHNLTVAPELIITKSRSSTAVWAVGTSFGVSSYQWLYLNLTDSAFNLNYSAKSRINSQPTSTQYVIATDSEINSSGLNYVAYLFATVAGVSKVGSYTGTGTTLSVDCGFTSGARFVMIKRTDSTGDWYVWDSARGIVAGNDPYLLLNSAAAEVTNTDYVDTYSAGFEISSTAPAAINANGGTFIFLAIA